VEEVDVADTLRITSDGSTILERVDEALYASNTPLLSGSTLKEGLFNTVVEGVPVFNIASSAITGYSIIIFSLTEELFDSAPKEISKVLPLLLII